MWSILHFTHNHSLFVYYVIIKNRCGFAALYLNEPLMLAFLHLVNLALQQFLKLRPTAIFVSSPAPSNHTGHATDEGGCDDDDDNSWQHLYLYGAIFCFKTFKGAGSSNEDVFTSDADQISNFAKPLCGQFAELHIVVLADPVFRF